MGRLIAVGDVHGEITRLRYLINALNLQPDDELVLLGDYIDRGEDSRATLEYVMNLTRRPNTTALQGNHERMLLDAIHDDDGDSAGFWLNNGGDKTSLDYDGLIPHAHEDFIANLPLYHQRGEYVFVHAGLNPNHSIAKQLEEANPDTLLWERDHLKANTRAWEPGLTVVCGHTIQRRPLITPQVICIDTGAFWYGTITAIDLTNKVIHQVHEAGRYTSRPVDPDQQFTNLVRKTAEAGEYEIT